MTDYFKTAADNWDAKPKINYKELHSHVSPFQKRFIEIISKQWIVFRDKEIQFSNQLFQTRSVMAMSSYAAQTKLELTRQITLRLLAHISDLTKTDE